MVTLVLGPSGSGKTKWLIDRANEEHKAGNGNIIFIDSEDSHIFSLDHAVRLVDASAFLISNIDQLYGFIAGILARDYDAEKIYLDGIYEIVALNKENLAKLVSGLDRLSEDSNVEMLIGLNIPKKDIPEEIQAEIVVLSTNE